MPGLPPGLQTQDWPKLIQILGPSRALPWLGYERCSSSLPLAKATRQPRPCLLPDGVSLQELHGRADQLRFVPLGGIVQRRVAQRGLRDKTAVIRGLGKRQLPLYNTKKQQRNLGQRENRGAQLKGAAGPEQSWIFSLVSEVKHQGRELMACTLFPPALTIPYNTVQPLLKSPQ